LKPRGEAEGGTLNKMDISSVDQDLKREPTANWKLKYRGRRRWRRILKVFQTIFHIRKCSVHRINIGRCLGVKVERKQLRGRHIE